MPSRVAGSNEERPVPVGAAEHDVSLADVVQIAAGVGSADDDVRETVAVHISGGGHRKPGLVATIDAVDGKAVGAVEGGERCRGDRHRRAPRIPGEGTVTGNDLLSQSICDSMLADAPPRFRSLWANQSKNCTTC